jgi:tRNA(adenine34) deaminase
VSDVRRSVPVTQADREGIEAALTQARAAASAGEVPVGAVVVRDGVVVAKGHNEIARRGDPTAHAELLAMQRALQTLGTDRLVNCTLYVTLEPCAQCAGAMVLAKVGRLVFGAYDEKAGMAGSIGDLVRHRRLNHHVDVQGGVLAEPCAALLVEFFKVRR